MEFYQDERTSVFIDGPNLHGTQKALGWLVDYNKLRQYFFSNTRLVHMCYFTMLKTGDDNVRKFTDWLEHHGYILVTKTGKLEGDEGQASFKTSIAMELAVGAMAAAQRIDHLVLVTGSGEYAVLAQALQDAGKRVTIMGLEATTSAELKRSADNFLNIADLHADIAKD